MTRRTARRIFVVASFAAIVTVIVVSRGGRWTAADVESISIDARVVRFTRHETTFVATLIRFDRSKTAASLVDIPENQTLADIAGDATLTINAGYFDAAFEPLGLYRIDGNETSPLLARPPLSGVLTIDDAGRLDVVSRDDTAVASARSAFQAGPFLIDPGGGLGVLGEDGKVAKRTVIAVDAASFVVIVTTPTTLHALAECLHDRPDAFGLARVDRALNLDGGPSTGFVLNAAGRRIASLPRGRIRSALTFATPP